MPFSSKFVRSCRVSLLSLLMAAELSISTGAVAGEGDQTLTLWTRAPGLYTDNRSPDRLQVVTVDPLALKPGRRRMFDAQYKRKETYIGIPLARILGQYTPKGHNDTALLHFANGMLVPVPLSDGSVDRLGAFLALKHCESRPASGKGKIVDGPCEGAFADLGKEDAYTVTEDPRPITFTWNKLAVTTPWHPDVPEDRSAVFSPWRHVDSLTGIEFINAEAYRAQFDVHEPGGAEVFWQRCQFCHGVRQVGSTFGWDFVTPLPIFEKRQPEQLLNHVKYPKSIARNMGLMMPVQKDVSLAEMQALWRYMRQAALHPLKPYRP